MQTTINDFKCTFTVRHLKHLLKWIKDYTVLRLSFLDKREIEYWFLASQKQKWKVATNGINIWSILTVIYFLKVLSALKVDSTLSMLSFVIDVLLKCLLFLCIKWIILISKTLIFYIQTVSGCNLKEANTHR